MADKRNDLRTYPLVLRKAIRAFTKELAALREKKDNEQKDKSKGGESKPKWTDRWMLYVTAALAVNTFFTNYFHTFYFHPLLGV